MHLITATNIQINIRESLVSGLVESLEKKGLFILAVSSDCDDEEHLSPLIDGGHDKIDVGLILELQPFLLLVGGKGE